MLYISYTFQVWVMHEPRPENGVARLATGYPLPVLGSAFVSPGLFGEPGAQFLRGRVVAAGFSLLDEEFEEGVNRLADGFFARQVWVRAEVEALAFAHGRPSRRRWRRRSRRSSSPSRAASQRLGSRSMARRRRRARATVQRAPQTRQRSRLAAPG
ncbi:MAG TPA: hypothetical protein PKK59_07550 [Anaerolineaceae bacterium]|nr:hypothetical protein [Anaerolineaceae bacterium]